MSTSALPLASGPFATGLLNRQMNPVWHRKSFAIGAMGPEVTFFDQAIGVGGIGPQHTNMTRSFELEAPRTLEVHAIRANLYDTDDADQYGIVKAYTMQFIVGGAVVLNAPIDWWVAGHGTTGAGLFNNGSPDHKAVYGLGQYPIMIPSNTSFSVRLIGSAGYTMVAAGMIGIFLDGVYSRGVS